MDTTPHMLPALRTSAELVERADHLVGCAYRRQIWFLLLDDEGVQHPVLPILEMPPEASERFVEDLAGSVLGLLETDGVHEVVVVWELPDPSGLDGETLPSMLAAAVHTLGCSLRGQLVVTRRGVTLWSTPARQA